MEKLGGILKINAIWAEDLNGVIGDGEKLLWHVPEDFKHFRKTTSKYPLIMGRKTFDSLPGVLPTRHHIVITRQNFSNSDNVSFVSNVDDAFKLAEKMSDNVFVIGGSEIFSQTLSKTDIIYRTIVRLEVETDTPKYAPKLLNYKIVSDSGWLNKSGGTVWKLQILKK